MNNPVLGTIIILAFATIGLCAAKSINAIGVDWNKVRKWCAVSVALTFIWTGLGAAVYAYGTEVLNQVFVVGVVVILIFGLILQGGRPRGW